MSLSSLEIERENAIGEFMHGIAASCRERYSRCLWSKTICARTTSVPPLRHHPMKLNIIHLHGPQSAACSIAQICFGPRCTWGFIYFKSIFRLLRVSFMQTAELFIRLNKNHNYFWWALLSSARADSQLNRAVSRRVYTLVCGFWGCASWLAKHIVRDGKQ